MNQEMSILECAVVLRELVLAVEQETMQHVLNKGPQEYSKHN